MTWNRNDAEREIERSRLSQARHRRLIALVGQVESWRSRHQVDLDAVGAARLIATMVVCGFGDASRSNMLPVLKSGGLNESELWLAREIHKDALALDPQKSPAAVFSVETWSHVYKTADEVFGAKTALSVKAMLSLGLRGGFRPGEFGLLSDKWRVENDWWVGNFVGGTDKNSNSGEVTAYIGSDIYDGLFDIPADLDKLRDAHITGHGLMFPSTSGDGLTYSSVSARFRRLAIKSAVPCQPYGLRRTAAQTLEPVLGVEETAKMLRNSPKVLRSDYLQDPIGMQAPEETRVQWHDVIVSEQWVVDWVVDRGSVGTGSKQAMDLWREVCDLNDWDSVSCLDGAGNPLSPKDVAKAMIAVKGDVWKSPRAWTHLGLGLREGLVNQLEGNLRQAGRVALFGKAVTRATLEELAPNSDAPALRAHRKHEPVKVETLRKIEGVVTKRVRDPIRRVMMRAFLGLVLATGRSGEALVRMRSPDVEVSPDQVKVNIDSETLCFGRESKGFWCVGDSLADLKKIAENGTKGLTSHQFFERTRVERQSLRLFDPQTLRHTRWAVYEVSSSLSDLRVGVATETETRRPVAEIILEDAA